MDIAGTVVAIVDDDDSVRRALSRLLVSLACKPVEFASGDAFLASLSAGVPDCVMLDLHMPGLQGIDVLHRLRERSHQVPAIIITAVDQTDMREMCLHAGASAYLMKPLERATVSSAIETAISV